jgi:hypothetical protein
VGIELSIYRIRGEHTNHYTTEAINDIKITTNTIIKTLVENIQKGSVGIQNPRTRTRE